MSNLYEQLKKYGGSDHYPFHMPGHKRNPETFGAGAKEDMPSQLFGIDITEIDGFDNLHRAEGILKEAQRDAAALYGAEQTFFLVNGSTCGILSAVAAAAGKGDRILAARNCHQSVYHAACLQELSVTFLYPGIVEAYGFAAGIDPAEVEQALCEGKASREECAAVIVTSPTYEGIVSDIREIAAITHRYGKILIVDEAHGAHFGFHEALPESAVRQGADLVIHSLHKTLPAMTQTALLHVSGELVDRERLRRYLKIFQTSSPSYVLMASMDSCLNWIKRDNGKECERGYKRMLQHRRRLEKAVSECRFLHVVKPPVPDERHILAMDPGKLILSTDAAVLTGWRLYDILRKQYHLQMEMAAERYAVAIITPFDTEDGFVRLARALREIDGMLAEGGEETEKRDVQKKGKTENTGKTQKIEKAEKPTQKSRAQTVMTIAQACSRPSVKRPVEECRGRTAAEFIGLYPPGIPLVAPGEELTKEALWQIEEWIAMDRIVQGVEQNQIKTVRTEGDQPE